MSGLHTRTVWPLALMNFADGIPNHAIALYLALVSTGFSDPLPDRLHQSSFALPNCVRERSHPPAAEPMAARPNYEYA